MPSVKRQPSKIPKASRPHMPGYGLPKGTKGLLPWKWAESRLKKSHNYWIATTRPDGRPHLMVIWGLWIDGAFYFSTGSQSRKALNLAKNANCVIGTERAEQAVVVEGVAELEMSVPMRRKVLDSIERKYDFDMSSFREPVLSLKEPIFVVCPKTAFGLDENKSLNAITRWQFGVKPYLGHPRADLH